MFSIHPVLIQGETSVGKTSLVRWIAAATGNQCVRINNHEHTDIQEYIGCYSSDEHGKLVFKEGAEDSLQIWSTANINNRVQCKYIFKYQVLVRTGRASDCIIFRPI